MPEIFQPENEPQVFQPEQTVFQPEAEVFQPEDEAPSVIGRRAVADTKNISGVFAEGFSTAMGRGGSFGLSPGSPTEKLLQDAGFLQDPELGTAGNALRIFDIPTRATIGALDAASRVMLAPFEGGIEAAGALYESAGGSQGMSRRLKRDLYGLLETAGIVTLASPLGVPGKAKTARKQAEKRIDEAVEEIPEGARETVKTAVADQFEATASLSDDALASARAKIGQPTLDDDVQAAIYSKGERARAEVLDRLAPIKFAAEKKAKAEGVTPDLSPYRDMRLVAGLRGVVESVLKRGTVTRTAGGVEFNGKSLSEVFSPVSQKMDDAMLYFAGRRAAELKGQGRERLFDQDEIAAMLRLGEENPEFSQVFDDYQAFNKRILDFAEQSGMLSPQTKVAFREMGQSYVPFYRVAEPEGIARKGKGSIFARLKGGEANVNEVSENIIRNATMWIDASVRNHALTRAVDTVLTSPLSDTLERITPPRQNVRVIDKQLRDEVKALGGGDISDRVVEALSFSRPPGDDIVQIFREGKREFYRVKDPVMLKALTTFTPKAPNLAMGIIGGFSNVLRRGVTMTPDFMLRNLVRDTQVAFVQSDTNFIPVVDSVRGMGHRMAQTDEYWNLLANGGGFATTYAGETRLGSNLSKYYRSQGINPSNVLDAPRKLADAAEVATSAFEVASRIGEFRKLAKRGDGLADAALGAREISTDFALRGGNEVVEFFTTAVPFLNARMQGLDRMAREAASNPGRFAIKGLTAITLPSLALHAYNRNDPRYAKMPDWVKDNHWVLFIPGKDEPFLIPKGFEAGSLFATVPERMFDAMAEQHGKRFADAFGRIVFETLSFNPVPQVAKPGVELFANRDFFFDAPIVPADLEDVRPSEQYRPWTSETLVQIAKEMREEAGVEISPQQVEHLIRGHFGTLGMYALEATDMLTRSVTGAQRPERRLDEIPVLKSFYRENPSKRTQYENDFYDLLGASREVAATVSHMIKQGRDPTLREDENRLFALKDTLGKVQTTAAQINRAIRLIHENADMSPQVKRERIDKLRSQKNHLFEGVMQGLAKNEEGMTIMRERGLLVPPGVKR